MYNRLKLILFVSAAALAVLLTMQYRRAGMIAAERDAYRRTSEALLDETERYRTREGEQAVKVRHLELTLADYRRFRAEDARTIAGLRTRLKSVETAGRISAETVYDIRVHPRDSVSAGGDSLRCVSYSDRWLDFEGCVDSSGVFGVRISGREELICVETVIYRRFLGFLWRTRRVERREQDIMSRNPNTTITDAEFITIKK